MSDEDFLSPVFLLMKLRRCVVPASENQINN